MIFFNKSLIMLTSFRCPKRMRKLQLLRRLGEGQKKGTIRNRRRKVCIIYIESDQYTLVHSLVKP